MGFETFVIPKRSAEKLKLKGEGIIPVGSLREAVNRLFQV